MPFQITINKSATTDDVLQLMAKVIREYHTQPAVSRTAAYSGGNLRRVFDYACSKVRYMIDPPGFERVTTPQRLLLDGFGDCKKFTVFIGSVLLALGIPFRMKVVSYDGVRWKHVYIIVPRGGKYITMDSVNHCRYNKEVNYMKAMIYDVNGRVVSRETLATQLSGMLGEFLDDIDLLK